MNSRNSNQVNAIRTTTQFCTDNASETTSITAFAGILTTAKNKLTLIDNYDIIAGGTTKGVTLDTIAIRTTMQSIALKCSRAVVAFASQPPKNNTLIAEVKYSKSQLDDTKKEDIATVCDKIRAAAHTNIAGASAYGISATDVSDLASAISLYNTASPNPRQAKINKSEAIKQIKILIKQINQDIFKNQMDNMILTLETSNPEFVSKYFKAREIIDLGTVQTKFRGDAIKKGSGPLPNVTAKLRLAGQDTIQYSSVTDENGQFKNTIVKPDTYDITYECPGYNTQSELNFNFPPGFEKEHHIEMIPV